MSEKITVTLSAPTLFPDLNKKEGLDAAHKRTTIDVKRMTFGHIKEMQTISPEQHTQWAIRKLTGLSDSDIDLMYAEDAAEVTQVIFGFIEKYFTLAKKMWQPTNSLPA